MHRLGQLACTIREALMGCVSRIIHDGGGDRAAPLPRGSHAGTTPRRAATAAANALHCAMNAKKVNHLNLMCINFMRKLPSGKVYLLGQ